ncbi:hypothetical protein VCV18_001500 [Metarhizium anisopliae]
MYVMSSSAILSASTTGDLDAGHFADETFGLEASVQRATRERLEEHPALLQTRYRSMQVVPKISRPHKSLAVQGHSGTGQPVARASCEC